MYIKTIFNLALSFKIYIILSLTEGFVMGPSDSQVSSLWREHLV